MWYFCWWFMAALYACSLQCFECGTRLSLPGIRGQVSHNLPAVLFNRINPFTVCCQVQANSGMASSCIFLNKVLKMFCLFEQSLASYIFSIALVEHVVYSEYFDAILVSSMLIDCMWGCLWRWVETSTGSECDLEWLSWIYFPSVKSFTGCQFCFQTQLKGLALTCKD